MTQDEAAALAGRVVSIASDVVKQQTGSSIVVHAFDLAEPLILKQVPALAILLPIVRKVMLPMIEAMLTPDQYTEVAISVAILEEALEDFNVRAAEARTQMEASSDADVDAYLRSNNLMREDQ